MQPSASAINHIKLETEDLPVNAPVVVMLHGWNRTLDDLRPLGEILSAHAKVMIIDLPGFGKTPPPPEEGWDTKNYAELVMEFLSSQGISRAVFVGHSFGGRISLKIAAIKPEMVQAIVLIGSHGLKPIRSLARRIKIAAIRYLGKLVKLVDRVFGSKIYSEKFAKKFGSPDYQKAGVLKNTLVKTVTEDQTADVSKIGAKALLLWGSNDTETPPAMGRRFNQLLENSKLIILEGKDHSPFHGVGAHLCANHIINFLKSL